MPQSSLSGPLPKKLNERKPGERLRQLRTQSGITARQVEELSRSIAAEQGHEEFLISHGRITQVENNESTPSIYKLCSLSAIYNIPLTDLISIFVDLESLGQYAYTLQRDQTRLVNLQPDQSGKTVSFPLRLNSGFDLDRTNLLSRLVQVWGEVPLELLDQLNVRSLRYGLIGLTDYTLYPLVKPGSFVQIDDSQTRILNPPSASEYDRPIYFIELRDGYACGWCEMHKNTLMILSHPLSNCKVRVFNYPKEAEVVGRVVAVAARIAPLRDSKHR